MEKVDRDSGMSRRLRKDFGVLMISHTNPQGIRMTRTRSCYLRAGSRSGRCRPMGTGMDTVPNLAILGVGVALAGLMLATAAASADKRMGRIEDRLFAVRESARREWRASLGFIENYILGRNAAPDERVPRGYKMAEIILPVDSAFPGQSKTLSAPYSDRRSRHDRIERPRGTLRETGARLAAGIRAAGAVGRAGAGGVCAGGGVRLATGGPGAAAGRPHGGGALRARAEGPAGAPSPRISGRR